MGKIYRTDDGQEMDEADFIAYLFLKVNDFVIDGLSEAVAVNCVTERALWGDSILDEKAFERIRKTFITNNQIVIK